MHARLLENYKNPATHICCSYAICNKVWNKINVYFLNSCAYHLSRTLAPKLSCLLRQAHVFLTWHSLSLSLFPVFFVLFLPLSSPSSFSFSLSLILSLARALFLYHFLSHTHTVPHSFAVFLSLSVSCVTLFSVLTNDLLGLSGRCVPFGTSPARGVSLLSLTLYSKLFQKEKGNINNHKNKSSPG